jgi:hypothetical protein
MVMSFGLTGVTGGDYLLMEGGGVLYSKTVFAIVKTKDF